MSRAPRSVESNLIASQFNFFVRHAFRMTHDTKLGEQPYVEHMCHKISRFIDGEITRLLINLPPQHLKSFVCTICLGAYLLGKNPKLRLLLAAYNDVFAEALCGRVRDMMNSSWYHQAFLTRIQDGHSRANDFATVQGGGVFAVGATGAVTGRSADVILYDDPHEIGDWNKPQKLELVRNNFNTILSRLQNRLTGRILVAAHRVSEEDLSAYLETDPTWKSVRHPLVATRSRVFDLGHDAWRRPKGDILRPDAYSTQDIERLRRTQVAPPFDLFYQQAMATTTSGKITPDHFQHFPQARIPIGPVVLSIDPGHGGGANGSRAVIQAWKQVFSNYLLIDEFCRSCDVETLRSEFWRFARRYRPSLALIEKTADGPALHALVQTKVRFQVQLIIPVGSKVERFERHRSKIRRKLVHLPSEAMWRHAFITEIVNFPSDFDDRVDAMTQYLDFADTRKALPQPEPRSLGVILPGRSISRSQW